MLDTYVPAAPSSSASCVATCVPLTSPVRHAVEVASEREASESETSAPSSQVAKTYMAHQVIPHHTAHQVIVVTDRFVYEQLKAGAAGARHGPVLDPQQYGWGAVEWAEGGLEVFRALTAAGPFAPDVLHARRANHDDVGPESSPPPGAVEASTELLTPATRVDLRHTHKLVSPRGVREGQSAQAHGEEVRDQDGQAEQSRARLDAGAPWQADDEKDGGLCRLDSGREAQDVLHALLQAPGVAHEHCAVAHEHRAPHQNIGDGEHRQPFVALPPASDCHNDERANDEGGAGGTVRRGGDVRFFEAPAPVLFGDGWLAGSQEEDVGFDGGCSRNSLVSGCSRNSALKTVCQAVCQSESLPAVLQILGSPLRRGIGGWHGIDASQSSTARHGDSGADWAASKTASSGASKTTPTRGSFTMTRPEAVAPVGLTRGDSRRPGIGIVGGVVQLAHDGMMQIAQGQAVTTPPSQPPVIAVPAAASRKQSAVSWEQKEKILHPLSHQALSQGHPL